MKHKLLICFLLWCSLLELRSQTLDSNQFNICNNLYELKQLQASYDCFMQYENNIYAIHHAALISLLLRNERNFSRLSEKLISKKYSSPSSYLLYADLYSFDSTRYFAILKKGLKLYCHDTLLLTQKTNYYITHKKYKKALTILDELILYQVTNKKSLYFSRGAVYEMMQEYDLAIMEYQKSIDFDSSFFDAYHNIGVINYNKAVILYIKANDQKTKEDYDKIKMQGDLLLEQAIPYLIHANLLKPDNLTVLTTLKTIYEKLNMNKELQEIKIQIKDIKPK